MVVKHLHASPAFLTVKRIPAHERFAGPAVKLMSCWVKNISFLYRFFVQEMDTIGRINFCHNIPKDDLSKGENCIENEQGENLSLPLIINRNIDDLSKEEEEK